ncbi:MAG: hypothetical protein ABW022_14830 [Actinoplanes sp.]
MSDRPLITAKLLFDPNLAVVCFCGHAMTVTRPAEATNGPLSGERGTDGVDRRCENCNVQIDVRIDA